MTTPDDVLKIAVSHLGYKEFPAGSNHNKFGVWYGMDYQPWCAMFVSYCLYNAGLALPISSAKGFAYCPFGVQWFKQRRKLDLNPAPGAIVFYDWNRNGVADHVGIVEKVNPHNRTIVAIEGNTSEEGNDSNGGCVMRRVRGLSLVQGFGHPDYSSGRVRSVAAKLVAYPVWPGRLVTLTSPPTSGNDIRLWQEQMIKRGWRLAPDVPGTFGPNSYQVLLSFQQEKGLQMDGVLGPKSWSAAWELPVT